MAWMPTGDPGPGGRIRGGLPARGLHQQFNPPGPVTAPGSGAGIFRGKLVIIYGTGAASGLFVYGGTPGPGNPPVFAVVAPGVTADPYGNPVNSVMSAGQTGSNFLQVDQFGDLLLYSAGGLNIVGNPSKKAIFIYSPAAGTGNLVASIAAASGANDGNGNAYDAGFCSYGTYEAQLQSGVLSFSNHASPATGAPKVQGQPAAAGSLLNLDSGAGTGAADAQLTLLDSLTSGLSQPAAYIPANLTVDRSDRIAAHTSPTVALIEGAAGSGALGIRAAADTNQRFRADSDGTLRWGSGTATPDVDLYRGAANLLKTDDALMIATASGVTLQDDAASGLLSQTLPSGMNGVIPLTKTVSQPGNTVTQLVLTNLFAFQINAGTAQANAVFEAEVTGNGTWQGAVLTLAVILGGNQMGTVSFVSNLLAAGTGFRWRAVVRATCLTAGVGGTWQSDIFGEISAFNANLTPAVGGNTTVPFVSGESSGTTVVNTTANQNLGLSAMWGNATNAPSITSRRGIAGRRA